FGASPPAAARPATAPRPHLESKSTSSSPRGFAGEEVIASPLALKKDGAQCALQSIDHCRQPLGIHNVEVGITLEIANRILERLQFIRHTNRLQNFVRQYKPCSVNLYSLQGRSRLPRPPAPTPVHSPSVNSAVPGRQTCLPHPLHRPFLSRLASVSTPACHTPLTVLPSSSFHRHPRPPDPPPPPLQRPRPLVSSI